MGSNQLQVVFRRCSQFLYFPRRRVLDGLRMSPRLAASVVAGWTIVQGNGYEHESRLSSVKPQFVSSCCPSPLSTQNSALTVSQRLGTSIPGADSRNGQLCMIFRKSARIALHSIIALGEIRNVEAAEIADQNPERWILSRLRQSPLSSDTSPRGFQRVLASLLIFTFISCVAIGPSMDPHAGTSDCLAFAPKREKTDHIFATIVICEAASC